MSTYTDIIENHVEKIRQEVNAVGLEVETSFTLADAMRLGAKTTGQKTFGFIDENTSCGLGAAYLAAKAVGYIPDAR